MMLVAGTPRPAIALQTFSTTARRGMFLVSVTLILMATRVEAHGLLERKIVFQAASGVVVLAKRMAIASRLAATRSPSTAEFCAANVDDGLPLTIASSLHAT